MSGRLLLRLTGEQESQLEWLSIDSDAPDISSGLCTAESVNTLPPSTHTTLVFPTCNVSFSTFRVPSRNPQQIELAVRSMIEEKLVDDVDDMHILSEVVADGKVEAAAVESSFFEDLVARLEACGLKADFAMPDCFLLPYSQDGWTIYESGEGLLIRTGPFSGFFYEHVWLDELGFGHITDISDDKPSVLHVYHQGESPRYDYQQLVPAESLQFTALGEDHGLLELALHSNIAGTTTNFLSGEFAPEQANRRAWLNWRLPVYATAASLVLVTIFLFIQGQVYDSRLQELRQQVDSTFRSVFPDVDPVSGLGDEAYRLQFQREVDKRIHQGEQNHPALISLYNVLSQVKKQPGITIQSLTYADRTYTIEMQSQNQSATSRIVSAVNRVRGLQAKALAPVPGADNKLSRIEIVEKGGA